LSSPKPPKAQRKPAVDVIGPTDRQVMHSQIAVIEFHGSRGGAGFKIGRLPGQQVQFVSEPPWSVVCDNGFGTIGTVSPQNLDRAALYDNHVTGSFSSADSHAPASTT
jgi:hypothetical protein